MLRHELYGDKGAAIDARRHRHDLAATDVYRRPNAGLCRIYEVAHRVGAFWQRMPGAAALRRHALDVCYAHILYEQAASKYQALSPMNGILNTLAIGTREPGSTASRASRAGVESWRWEDEAEGVRYAGARSTTWDTSFAMLALLEMSDQVADAAQAARRGYRRLAEMQVTEELADGPAQGRDPICGGWCFSDGAHRWPVSDCTAQALSAILRSNEVPGLIPVEERMPPDRLRAAAAFILARQNRDGGFGTYERRRGGRLVERLNPSEMFGNCMTELSYVECTASAIGALTRFLKAGLAEDGEPVRQAIARGIAHILARQGQDGAWAGFWGINFIYGTKFAVAGLREAGLPPEHPTLQRARAWLCSVQHLDGGWGEDFSGSLSGCYVDHPVSLVISTAWALLALLDIEAAPSAVTQRGIEWLVARQNANGDWPRDSVNGVFFSTAMLNYRLYNSYFPAWALGRFEVRQHAGH